MTIPVVTIDSSSAPLELLRQIHETGEPLPAGLRQPKIVHISMYCFKSFAIRIFHNLTRKCGAETHSFFFKDVITNEHKPVTEAETGYLLERLQQIQPDVITMSLMSPYVPAAKALIARIRNVTTAPVVLGGKFPTIDPTEALEFADYACKGEGELVLIEMIERLKRGEGLEGITGLWHNDAEGKPVDRGQMRLIEDVDLIPFQAVGEPGMAFVEHGVITERDPEMMNDEVWVMAGRGCVYLCSYCVNSLLIPMNRGNGRFVRLRSPDSIIAEINHLRARQPLAKAVSFNDEVFGVFDDWTTEFSEKYRDQVGLPFHCELVPKLIKAHNVDKLLTAGLEGLHFGIQSGSDDLRKEVMHRPGKNAELIEKANMLAGKGIKPVFDLIMGSPFDGDKEMEDTIDLLLAMPQPMALNVYQMQFFPHYPLTKLALERGLVSPDELTYERLAENVMYNMVFIPKVSAKRKDHLEAAVYLFPWSSAAQRWLARRLREKPSLTLGIVAGVVAKIRYHLDFLGNPVLVWLRRGLVVVTMMARGDVRQLASKIRQRISEKLKAASLSVR